jgi:serine/threonine-protein kinase RsbT
VTARQRGRELAQSIGFSGTDLTIIATAISEVARNILTFAREGEIILTEHTTPRPSIGIVARDEGPGIRDIPQVMQDGYSTRVGLGLGLPGCRRLMDEFQLESTWGSGTTIKMKKWLRADPNQ